MSSLRHSAMSPRLKHAEHHVTQITAKIIF